MMRWLNGFAGLIYDLVIGDCWLIAAATASLLAAGIGLLKASANATPLFSGFLGGAIMIGAALVIYCEARVSYRRNDSP